MRRLWLVRLVTASNRAVGIPSVFVDPPWDTDPSLQAGAFRFAAPIAQHARAIGNIRIFQLRGAQRARFRAPSTPCGSNDD
jgi:hypothetical protein